MRDAVDTSYRDLPAPLASLHRAVGAVPGPFTAELAAGVVGDTVAASVIDVIDVIDVIAGLVHRSLLTPLGPAGRAGRRGSPSWPRSVGMRSIWPSRPARTRPCAGTPGSSGLVRARPALGSTRYLRWYGALDDDLAALRATLHHTLVDAPSATGVALAARLSLYWGFSGMAVESERWRRNAADVCAAQPELGRSAERAVICIDLGALLVMQGRIDEGRAQVRAGIAEGAGVTGDDAVLVCTSLAVAAGPLARAREREVLAELAAASRRMAAGSAALEVAVRHIDLVHATVVAPDPGLGPPYLALHRHARAEDNLYTAWLSAMNAARLLLAADRVTEALTWARVAVQDSAELGLRTNPYALEVYGAALGRAGEHAAALRVFGAVEDQHGAAGVMWPYDPSVIALLAAMRERLGPAAADHAQAAGARAALAELADI